MLLLKCIIKIKRPFYRKPSYADIAQDREAWRRLLNADRTSSW